MQIHKRTITILAILVFLYIANLRGMNISNTQSSESASPAAVVFEGELIFNKELPVNITTGTAEHPKLIEIKSISFENTYGNAWAVTVHVGWLPVIDSTWEIKAEMLDEDGRVLRHSRDGATIFTCKAAKTESATMQYADLEMDSMLFQGRLGAYGFRVYLELVQEQVDLVKSDDEVKTHTFEIAVVELKDNKPLAESVLVVSSIYLLDTYTKFETLYMTDSQGCCEIKLVTDRLATLNLSVQKPGFATMTKSFSGASAWPLDRTPLVYLPENYIFEMLDAYTMGGIVQDENSNPIEAANVRLDARLDDQSGTSYLRRGTKTNVNGQWQIEGIPSEADRISIGLRHPDYGGDNGTSRYLTGQVVLEARELKYIDTLYKGMTLTGQVLNEDGRAVVGATVMLSQRSGMPFYAITDSAGKFRLVCSDDRDTYDEVPMVIVETSGYAPTQKVIEIESNPEPLEFKLNRGRTIKCQVVDSGGNPVTGAWTVVEPFLPDNRDYSIWLEDTNEQGELEIRNVPDTDLSLTVGKQGYITVRDFVLVDSEESFTVPIERALTITGSVTDAQTGRPIPNFEITPTYSSGDRNNIGSSVVFVDGKFELVFSESSSMNWQLMVTAVGYQADVSDQFWIDEGSYVMNFELPRGADYAAKTAGQPRIETNRPDVRRITGIVRDEEGEPVQDVVISTRPMIEASDTMTNAEGKFTLRLRNVSRTRSSSFADEVFILARHKERNLAAAVSLDETPGNLEIKLLPGVIFSGRVVDVNDKGIPDAEMSMVFWLGDTGFGSPEPTEVDSEGNFEIRAIPHGFRYSVEAQADSYGPRYVRVHTSQAVNDSIELEPLVLEVADLPTSGIVVDEYDQPIANVRIYAYGNGQPTQQTYTDENGKFTLEKICRGQLIIQASKENPERLHGRVEVEGGAQNVKIVVNQLDSEGRPVPRTLPSLIGKSLPDFENIQTDFSPEEHKDKKVLICFWDMEQRPSRHCISQINQKADQLTREGITIIAVHASKIEQEKLDEWLKENNISFSVGIVEESEQQTRFNWGIKSLPWLILTDNEHIVTVEGFSINELDEKIQ